MRKRKFSREFKIEAVKLVRERGVSAAQAARDLDVHENVLRKWVKEFGSDPAHAFPGHSQMKPEHLEIERLKREVNKLKAERDILKKDRGLLRGGSDMKLAFVAKHRTIRPVAWLCVLQLFNSSISSPFCECDLDPVEFVVCWAGSSA